MAHFAQLNDDNTVLRVIVVANAELIDENGQESEAKGAKFCADLLGGRWIQTSYNGTFRKNFAGAGMKYDAELDAFIGSAPFPSWVLNTDCSWVAPVPHPNDGQLYDWDESNTAWVKKVWDDTAKSFVLP